MDPFSAEELNELAAGYVLGDLTSEEAALFQQQLQQDAALQARVAQLQQTLSMMAWAVPSQETPPGLRSRIMQSLDSTASRSTGIIKDERRSNHPAIRGWIAAQQNRLGRGSRWILWGTGAAFIAIALGMQQYQLKQQIAMLETALSQQQPDSNTTPVREIPLPAGTALTMEAPAELLAQQWPGLQSLSQDHQQSHLQDPGPGQAKDLPNSDGIPKQLLERLTPSPAMPRLLEKTGEVEAQFVKITPCKMGKIQGLRMTYLLDQQTPVSVYKLEHGEDLPQPGAEAVSLQSTAGLSMILWEEDTFLYAIVSDLPVNRLKNLTIDS